MLLYEVNEAVDLAGGEDVSQALTASLVHLYSECAVKISASSGPDLQALDFLHNRRDSELLFNFVQKSGIIAAVQ